MDRDLEGRDRDLEPETKPRGDDVQQLVVVKEEVPPEQQEWSPSLDQEDPPEPPHIKEEQEELWTSQEGEQLQGLEEADITKFLFTPVPVKSEDDEEKPQSSQLHQRQTEQMETGADGEDCGGPEPARNSHPDPELGLVENEDFSETEDSPDSYLWKESIECPSGSKSEAPENHNTVQKLFSCSECGERFCLNVHLKRHMRIHTGKKPICCSFCGETFTERVNLSRHMVVHTGEKLFSCSECGKIFRQKGSLTRHKCLGPWSSRHNRSQMEGNREPEPGASSSTEQMETGADGEDCGGPEPARNSSPDPHAHAYIEYEIEDSYPDPELGPETPDFSEMEDSEDFSNKTTEPQSHLKQTGCYKEAGLCARERAELRRAEAATMAKQGKLPIPALPEHSYTAYTRKHLKRKRTEEEKKEAKEAATQNRKGRCMTRIYIGPAFDRWKDLKESKGLKSDAQLALLLLDSYERDDATVSTPFKHRGKRPLTSTLSSVTRRSPESMSSVDLNETFRVEEFNSLNNATIEWEDEKDDRPLSSSQEDVTREFDIDEDYVPRICVRSGGVLSSKVNIDNVPEVSIDQSVHDDGGEDGPGYIPDPDSAPDVHDEDDIVGHPASIAYHTSLQQLVDHLELPEHVCTVIDPSTMAKCGAPKPFTVRITSRGTAAIIEWICARGHTVWKWASQPFLNLGMPVGDFLLSCNVLLSGNNYAKIALLFKFMNMGMVHQTTFRNIQDIYCIDTIKDFWNTRRSEIITRLKQKDSVVALGGARMDSPGFCTQHCTYTTMDNDTKEIISVVNMDKRATARNSVIMQREAFIRTFDTLHEEVKLTEFCTDAHVQISSLFEKGKYKDSGVHHSLDMWHGAKILGEKIREAAQQKDCTILHEWNKDICNHFWHCCKMTDDFHTFFDKWTGVLHHVTGEHSWIFGACEHDPLTDNRDKHLIQKDSKAHQTLTEIVLNEQWLKSVGKYLHFRSTAELESFHNHILMYAGKRFGFSPPVYGARVLLAALDYNHHLSRSPKINAAGQYEYRKLYNKKSRKWTLRTLKETKSYSYIPALQRAVLHKRLSGGGMPSVKPRTPDDPRHQH